MYIHEKTCKQREVWDILLKKIYRKLVLDQTLRHLNCGLNIICYISGLSGLRSQAFYIFRAGVIDFEKSFSIPFAQMTDSKVNIGFSIQIKFINFQSLKLQLFDMFSITPLVSGTKMEDDLTRPWLSSALTCLHRIGSLNKCF